MFGRKPKPCESLDCLDEAGLEIAYQRLRSLAWARTPHETHLMRLVAEKLREKYGINKPA